MFLTAVAVAVKTNKLLYGRDLNVVNCPDGKTKVILHNEGATVKVKQLEDLFKDGCTVQLFRPQLYDDDLWERMEALEAQVRRWC